MSTQQQNPIVGLKEGTTETKDKQAQRNNIRAAKVTRYEHYRTTIRSKYTLQISDFRL
jgi:hypothetical protein